MTKKIDIAAVRARLLALRAGLAQSREQSADSRRPVALDQTSVGRVSRVDALQVQAMALETERRRDIEGKRIDGALARLDAGEYGECMVCGEDIAPARLEFDPAVAVCITCARGAG